MRLEPGLVVERMVILLPQGATTVAVRSIATMSSRQLSFYLTSPPLVRKVYQINPVAFSLLLRRDPMLISLYLPFELAKKR